VKLGRVGGQMHGNQDLLDDSLGLDEGDEAQPAAAGVTSDLDGKGTTPDAVYDPSPAPPVIRTLATDSTSPVSTRTSLA